MTKSFITCESTNDLLEKLKSNFLNETPTFVSDTKTVFLFPGQGSQFFEMGKEIYENDLIYKAYFDEGIQLINRITGEDYSKVIGYTFSENKDKIHQTLYTQPILFLLEYALAKTMIRYNIIPDYLLGHSLGEYTAACIAEVMSLENALKLIIKRAQLMMRVRQGKMISVGVPSSKLASLLSENVSIAARNTEKTCVISGEANEIDVLIRKLNLQGIPTLELKTSHAFHSCMMEEILDDFSKILSDIPFAMPKSKIISNINGELLDTQLADGKYWIKQLRSTVEFSKGIDTLFTNENIVFVEIGPGNTLLNFVKKHKKKNGDHQFIPLFNNKSKNQYQDYLNALGGLWTCDFNINWSKFYENTNYNKLSIPTYCFDKTQLTTKVDPLEQAIKLIKPQFNRKLSDWFYIPIWKRSFDSNFIKNEKNENYLFFGNSNELSRKLVTKLIAQGNHVLEVFKEVDTTAINEKSILIDINSITPFSKLFDFLDDSNRKFTQIVYFWEFNNQEYDLSPLLILQLLCKGIMENMIEEELNFTYLTSDTYEMLRHNIISDNYTQALIDVFAQENPTIQSTYINVEESNCNEVLIDNLIKEFTSRCDFMKLCYRENKRWIKSYDKIGLSSDKSSMIKENGLYLITGGLGSLGLVLTNHLLTTYNATVIILGRTDLNSSKDNFRKAKFDKLKNISNNVYYYDVDVSDVNSFKKVVQEVESEHGSINGVLHLAGNIEKGTFKALENLTKEILLAQVAPKIYGIINIDKVFEKRNLDFVWITSSLSSIVGGLAYGAYSVANRFIDCYVQENSNRLQNWFSLNLDNYGVPAGINGTQLIQVFEQSFLIDEYPQLIISLEDINVKLENIKAKKQESESLKKIPNTNRSISQEKPKSLTQIKLASILQNLLEIDSIGIKDDFFELGVDSLRTMTLQKKIHKEYNLEIALEKIFELKNIEKLALEIDIINGLEKISNKEEKKTKQIRL